MSRKGTPISDMVDIPDKMIADAAEWYANQEIPEAIRNTQPAAVIKYAAKAIGADKDPYQWRRCYVDTDGTLIIDNKYH